MKEAEPSGPAETSDPVYCPIYDWNKALALFQETPLTEPGAHRLKLGVGFASAGTQAPA